MLLLHITLQPQIQRRNLSKPPKNNKRKQLSLSAQEKLEDIKRVTQRRKYKKDRQYNGQKKYYKNKQ